MNSLFQKENNPYRINVYTIHFFIKFFNPHFTRSTFMKINRYRPFVSHSILIAIAALCIILFPTCSKEEKKNESREQSSTRSNTTSAEQKISDALTGKRYKIKSCIVTSELNMGSMGMKQTQVLYFDDYGKKECRESMNNMSVMGRKINQNTISIRKDGYMYSFDLEKKTGTKMQIPSTVDVMKNLDFSKLSDDVMKEWNMVKEGTQTVLGKECNVLSMKSDKMGMQGKYYVWNNIPLKSETRMSGMVVSLIATKIEENVDIPASKFEIPADIKFREINLNSDLKEIKESE